MADVQWLGAAQSTPQVDTFTVGSATAAQTFTVTINGKTVTYTAGSGETTSTVASGLQALLAASSEGEFSECTWAASGATVTATGPSDGAPITTSAGGTGALSKSTTTNPVSPHDAGNGANYSTGALPTASSRLVLQNSNVSILYGLSALTNAISFLRLPTYTGQVGLPDISSAGNYREYRSTHLSLNSTSITVQESSGDSAGQFRLTCTAGSACTVTVTGSNSNAQVGSEVLEVTGLPASSLVNCVSGSVAVSPLDGQTSTVATLTGGDATLTLGLGVTLTTATLRNCQVGLECGYTTLNLSGNGTTTVTGSGSGTTTNVYSGTLAWQSTGSPGTPTLGPGAILDLTEAPAAITLGGTMEMDIGAAVKDPGGRLATSSAFRVANTTIPNVSLDLGPNRTITLTT